MIDMISKTDYMSGIIVVGLLVTLALYFTREE